MEGKITVESQFATCGICNRYYDYGQENGPKVCQKCQRGIPEDVKISEVFPLITLGIETDKYLVRVMEFPPCKTYPKGIILQHDAFPAWNLPSSMKITTCVCKHIGKYAIWTRARVEELPNCNGEVYIGTLFDGPFKNGSTVKTPE